MLGSEAEIKHYLFQKGWITDEKVQITPLSGGVSNQVWEIETIEGRYIMKQALPKLKVKIDWYSDVDRIFREQNAMMMMQSLLPGNSTPKVTHQDSKRYIYMMTAASKDTISWKEQLLMGNYNDQVAKNAGKLLRNIHIHSKQLADVHKQELYNLRYLEQLRIAPFHRYLIKIHPNLKEEIETIISDLTTIKECFVHGDYSPKNMLVDKNCNVMIIDFEVSHWGNPVFDIAFCLSHLMLKGWAFNQKENAFRLIESFFSSYGLHVSKLLAHLGLLLLARIDGKSTVDYIDNNKLIDTIRNTAVEWIRQVKDSVQDEPLIEIKHKLLGRNIDNG
jgi:5-methylthioribose kinase